MTTSEFEAWLRGALGVPCESLTLDKIKIIEQHARLTVAIGQETEFAPNALIYYIHGMLDVNKEISIDSTQMRRDLYTMYKKAEFMHPDNKGVKLVGLFLDETLSEATFKIALEELFTQVIGELWNEDKEEEKPLTIDDVKSIISTTSPELNVQLFLKCDVRYAMEIKRGITPPDAALRVLKYIGEQF